MSNIILSPHFDDAVFNCFSIIQKSSTTVVTVFAGSPDKNIHTVWDRICHESNSSKMVAKREVENKNALRITKTKNINLEFLDAQYRTTKDDLDGLYREIKKIIPTGSTVYVPLAMSTLFAHPDHVLIRDIGLKLIEHDIAVFFYPDQPYMRLWSKSKLRKPKLTKLTNKFAYQLNQNLQYRVERFKKDELALKKMAMHKYQSQYFYTNLFSANGLNRILRQRYELFFEVVKS